MEEEKKTLQGHGDPPIGDSLERKKGFGAAYGC